MKTASHKFAFGLTSTGWYLALIALGLLILAFPAFAVPAEPPSEGSPKYVFELSYADAEAAISQALVDKEVGKKIAATINSRKGDAVFSYTKPLAVEIRGLSYDKPTGRWSASLLAVSGEEVISAVPVAGRFEEVMEVPVLKRQVRSGETIAEADIDIQTVAIARTRPGTITSSADLVGKSPDRSISAYRPVRENEIARPALVKKNDIVQMRYVAEGIEITATGQAVSGGAKGDMIPVKNLASKKTVHARIEDDKTVSVGTLESKTAQADKVPMENTHAAN
jgi:flagellar basal body P-ring formation protein FlgA